MRIAVAALALLGACTQDPPSAPAANEPSTESKAASREVGDLAGTAWRILEVDGRPAGALAEDGGGARLPRINFGRTGYGGTTGCNYFGGLSAQVDERLFTLPAAQTAMGCGTLAAQEATIIAVLAAAPTLAYDEDGRLVVSAQGRRMRLVPEEMGGRDQPAQRDFPVVPLAGTAWTTQSVNGAGNADSARGYLRFFAERIEGRADCGQVFTGSWGQKGDFLAVSVLQPICERAGTRDKALADLLTSGPRIVTGPNGEMLLASASGWAVLQRQ